MALASMNTKTSKADGAKRRRYAAPVVRSVGSQLAGPALLFCTPPLFDCGTIGSTGCAADCTICPGVDPGLCP